MPKIRPDCKCRTCRHRGYDDKKELYCYKDGYGVHKHPKNVQTCDDYEEGFLSQKWLQFKIIQRNKQ